jgi:glycerol-3-phosphate acyltransferase PlsY
MWVRGLAVLILAYVLGSIPFGWFVVRLRRGRDIRQWYSGRTGGTNVMRVAGLWSGLATAIIDVGKAALAVFCARWFTGGGIWWEVGAGILAVLGHNSSIFLTRKVDGKWVSGGGAGGAAAFGAAIGIWPPSALIILPFEVLIYLGIGYASVTTISIPLIAGLIFLIRASLGLAAWQYLVFALGAELLIVWALRPNLQRLAKGEERLVGWRARRKLANDVEQANKDQPAHGDV